MKFTVGERPSEASEGGLGACPHEKHGNRTEKNGDGNGTTLSALLLSLQEVVD